MKCEKFLDATDEEIVKSVKDGDQQAMDYLMEKYKDIVRKKARTLFLIGGEKEDLIQEGMIGLYKAIRDYDKTKDASFYSFADLCISRQIYSAITESNRKKNIPLNNYISLYSPVTSDTESIEEHTALLDTMLQKQTLDPESLILDQEQTSIIEDNLNKKLSDLEKRVLELYLDEKKYVTIAHELEKDPKSIDNALQRIKAKLNQVLKEIS